ncbi:DUF2637 domain-containing protein [Streptomyces sp. KL116D]|uniref:DUF2637 domain-containing protein n=1 Tax=Streptomyces sp. KL116D TaxID=3045152 RepID=UPI003555E940
MLLALDLLLTWIRIPFPLLRQTAWLLTAATIAFNGAAAWPDPLGVGMHAVIPILFVVSVEAARHAIGPDRGHHRGQAHGGRAHHALAALPVPTFLLWRRMKLWELRSYEAVIKLEQERLVYQARLHSRFGRAWRRKAPVRIPDARCASPATASRSPTPPRRVSRPRGSSQRGSPAIRTHAPTTTMPPPPEIAATAHSAASPFPATRSRT